MLAWARRGISETSGWQIAQLDDLAAGVYARQSRPGDVLALRREQHNRMASVSTYGGLRSAAEAEGVWPEEREAARTALRERDLGALVDVLLDDGEPGAGLGGHLGRFGVGSGWSAVVAAGRGARTERPR